MKIYQTFSSAETKKIGDKIGKQVANSSFAQLGASKLQKRRGALILALLGELGAGKTTFTQGFLKGLGVREPVNSPTFVIFRRFRIAKNKDLRIPSSLKLRRARKSRGSVAKNGGFKNVYHFDCYRIHEAAELKVLGIKEIFENPGNIVLIEWPEQIKKILPKNIWQIEFRHGKGENERVIRIR